MKETIAQEALRLLSSIPAEDFISYDFSDEIGKCCAIGHYQRLKSSDPKNYSIINCDDWFSNSLIRIKSSEFLKEKHGVVASIATVNNNKEINGYNEPEIKDRVIHLLNDMVAAGL